MSGAVLAQDNPDSGKPLEITADESLEWHRNDFFFQAKKNVVVVQGATTLYADNLVAHYREVSGGGMDIYRIEADENVKIISDSSTAYGDKAVYDIDKAYAVMTGKSLKVVSKDQEVTARDKLEYWIAKRRFEAYGNVVAKQSGDVIEGDKMMASFVEGRTGDNSLKTLEAHGNVVITTPTEVLTGDKALYRADSQIAELIDNVTIKRGPNTLNGSHAKVNLKTNVSKLFGGQVAQEGGRVHGVFYPGSENVKKD